MLIQSRVVLENLAEVLLLDADPAIFNDHADLGELFDFHRVIGLALLLLLNFGENLLLEDRQLNPNEASRVGELETVADKVEEDL